MPWPNGVPAFTSRLLNDIFRLAYRHRLRLPANVALLAKTLAMSEGLGRRLDPDFRTVDVLTPFVRRLLLDEYGFRGLEARRSIFSIILTVAAQSR